MLIYKLIYQPLLKRQPLGEPPKIKIYIKSWISARKAQNLAVLESFNVIMGLLTRRGLAVQNRQTLTVYGITLHQRSVLV